MKTRLLKKVRKRFEIIHMPNGFTSSGRRNEWNLFKLTDSSNNYFATYSQLGHKEGDVQFAKESQIFETKEECIHYLKGVIIDRLRDEGHLGAKDHSIKKMHTKVWHI